jgi:hypothetical protein
MEVGSSIFQAMGLHSLQSTCKRQKDVHIHILVPAHCMSLSNCEHVLDFEPSLKRSPFDTGRPQKGELNSTAEPQPDLKKSGEDTDLGHLEYDARAQHQAPALDNLCPGSFGECTGPPSWCQTHFKLDRPSPPDAFPLTPFLSHSTRNNFEQRKSCEFCRFRKKKCSGHSTCVRCSRAGIDCVYLPDLIAKRTTDRMLETRLLPGSHLPTSVTGSCDGQFSRGTKRRKRAPNGSTKRQKRLRAETHPLDSSPSQSIPLGDDSASSPTGSGSLYVELAKCLAGSVLGTAAEDMDPMTNGPQCVSLGVLDRRIYVLSVPRSWDASQPEVFGDTSTMRPGYTKNDRNTTRLDESSMDVGATGAETSNSLGFDLFPFMESGLFLESSSNLPAQSTFYSSPVPPSPSSTVPLEKADDCDLTSSWTTDDWLEWYGSTSFLW